MSQLVQLEGKHSTQNAHCALSTKSCLKWNKLRPILNGQFCSCSNYLKYMENFDYWSILVDSGSIVHCGGSKSQIYSFTSHYLFPSLILKTKLRFVASGLIILTEFLHFQTEGMCLLKGGGGCRWLHYKSYI